MKRKKRQVKYKPWVCDECKVDKSGVNCVRPEHCEVSQEKLRDQADFRRKQIREDGI